MEIGSRVRHDGLGCGSYGTVLAISDAGVTVRLDGFTLDRVVDARLLYCPADHERAYRIVRFYRDPLPYGRPPRTIARGLTLAEAQAHCSDPETSSSTARGKTARARTRRVGAWFDGYDRQ